MEKKKYITKKRSFHTDKRTVNFSWLFMNIDGMIYSGNCIKRYHFKRWPYIRWIKTFRRDIAIVDSG